MSTELSVQQASTGEQTAPAIARVLYEGREYRFTHSDPQDHIFSLLKSTSSFYELPLLEALVPLVARGSTVVDVGANIGNHAVFFAGALRCKVVAIEPNPVAVALLSRNAELNGLTDRIEVRECAIGADRRKGNLIGVSEHNLGTAAVRADPKGTIEVIPLDQLKIEDEVSLLKIDVEGLEYDVLLGGMEMLRRCRPILAVEAPLAEDYKRIAELIAPLGYVPMGSYNYTPTHLFGVPAEADRAPDEVIDISHRLALQYIQTADRTAGVDRHLSSIRQQVRQFATNEKATTAKLDANEAALSKTWAELKEVRASLESKLAAVLAALGTAQRQLDERLSKTAEAAAQGMSALDAATKRLADSHGSASAKAAEHIAALEGRLQQSVEAIDSRQEADVARLIEAQARGVAEQQARLVDLDSFMKERLQEIAQIMERSGVESRLAAVLAAVESTERRIEKRDAESAVFADQIAALVGVYEGRLEAMETKLAVFSGQLDAALGAMRRRDDVMVELQLLGVSDREAKLKGLETRIDGVLKHELRASLEEMLERRFAELTSCLTSAIGVAIADRKLADEIAGPSSGFDIAKAMAVLGIPSSDNGRMHAADAQHVGKFATTVPSAAAKLNGAIPHASLLAQAQSGKLALASGMQAPGQTSPLLFEFDYATEWANSGFAQGDTSLEVGGRISTRAATPRLGYVGRMFACPGGGLIELDIEMPECRAEGRKPILRLQTEMDFPVGHDFVLEVGKTTVRAFAPSNTRKLKFYVLMLDAPADSSFRIGRIAARRLNGEAHQRAVSLRVKEPVLASMATIPSRREMLQDCVASLLVQCDRVRVFLNNYPDVPGFLSHPRVEVRCSQDWDDRGDAGKLFWVDKDRDEGGYRLIVDDDLIFPPDFVDVMTSKVAANAKKAIFATHGVLLRQPIVRYYEPSSRANTFHFGQALDVDRGVHIGATNAMCLHSSAIDMAWDDFKYCNSADVWLSMYAQAKGLPMLTPARPHNWVRENTHAVPTDTIYHHSLKRTRTRFDSSHVQDASLRHAWPITLKTGQRQKAAVAIVGESPQDLVAALPAWLKRATEIALTTELVVMLAYDFRDAALAKAVEGLKIPHETHLIDTSKLGGDVLDEFARHQGRLGIDALLAARDRVSVATAPPADLTLLEAKRSSVEGGDVVTWQIAGTERGLALSYARGERGRQALQALLGSSRLSIAKSKGDGSTLGGIDDIPQTFAKGVDAGEKIARLPQRALSAKRPHTVNSVFERVVVINLDRRTDRWKSASARLARAGIKAERFSAIDGKSTAVAEEYAAYAQRPLHIVTADLPPIERSADLYLGYASQMARIAHIEGTTGRKAITSPGAWGCLRSYEAIFEQSLADQHETLLVLHDDVVLHKDFHRLFDEAISQLPSDWLIVQLGTLQYNWSAPWAQKRTPMLYQTNGAAAGYYAVGMRFDILPSLLDHTKRMDIPFDLGPLSAATRAFADRCFVVAPNLAIHSLDTSDIATEAPKPRSFEKIAQVHRWKLAEYDH